MKNSASLFILLLLCSNCGDKENINLENVEVFSSEKFKRYPGYSVSVEKCLLSLEETIVAVGNGSQGNSSFIESFFLEISADKEIDKLEFLASDDRSLYRMMDVITTQDGNLIYCSQFTEPTTSDVNIDLRKLNQEGELVWQKSIGQSTRIEKGASITQLPNSDYIVIGSVQGINSTYPEGYLLARVSDEGEEIWSKEIPDENVFFPRKVLYLPADSSVLVLTEYIGFSGVGEIKITKFNLDGDLLSSKSVTENTNSYLLSSGIKILNDGNVLVYISSAKEGSSNNYEIDLFKLDSNLEEYWVRSDAQLESNIVSDVFETTDNELLVLSESSRIGNGGLDLILSKLDSNGDEKWKKVYGSESSDQGTRVFEKVNKDILVIGNTNHETGSEAKFEMFLLETDAAGIPK
jgi:hypothetical protein